MPDASSVKEREPETAPEEEAAAACHSCKAALPVGAEVCPACGRKQTRTCFCGTPVAVDTDECPVCGADWSSKIKIRRRSRSVRVRPKTLARSALTGALITVMASAILNIVVNALAQPSMPAGPMSLPFTARLYYAGCTLVRAVDLLFTRLLGGVGPVLMTAIAGAVVGVLLYLVRAGYWRSRSPHGAHGVSRRRRSR